MKKIEKFYTEIVGLEKLGGFENHNNYDGLFLGHKNSNWHLEFTTSNEKPQHKFDEDDILVFYVSSKIELKIITNTIETNNILIATPKNPYWIENGLTISDPDGFNIVFSLRELNFTSNDDLTNLAVDKRHSKLE